MEAAQRATIRKCRVRIVKDLLIDEMLDSIEASEMFTAIMLEYIKAKDSRPEKVRVFLDYLQRRGPDAFDKFLQCLQESGHHHIRSYVLQEYLAQCGQGISKVNAGLGEQGKNQRTAPSSRPSNMYIAQETPGTSTPHQEQGQIPSPEQAGTQEMGSSMEESGTNPEDEVFQNVCCSEEDMDMDLTAEPLASGVQESGSADMSSTRCRTERQESNLSESSAPGLTSSSSVISLSQGYTGNEEEEYKMETDPRGLLLIINNKDFSSGLSTRHGTDVDCDKLRSLFMSIGFGVDVRTNLTALEMKINLAILAKHPELQNVACLSVAILTHGSEEVLYGVDGKFMKVNEALEPFNAENCPALHNKPKFFIINACRGDSEDNGAHTQRLYEDSVLVQQDTEPMPIGQQNIRIPKLQDFLLAYSTLPGHVSWRHQNDGSWFIQGLVKVFSDYANHKDILSMLTKVNQQVSRNINHSGVQIPAPQFMLTKTWYLNPSPREPV